MQESKQAREAQDATIRHLESSVGQISGTVNQMQQQQQTGKLPIQPQQPHQAQVVTVLRSGKTVDNKMRNPYETVDPPVVEEKKEEKEKAQPEVKLYKAANPYKPPVPFPSRLRNEKQDQQFADFYKMLSKVNVNLPILDMTRNVSAYVKFFKELASKKRKFVDNEPIKVSEVANSIMQQPLPPKQCDPGSFVISIALGNGKEGTSMLDLGAGINLMQYSIFKQLELGELKPTRMCLQLADRSVRYPKGIVEDILVHVGGLIVLVDFVVLEIGEVHENGREHMLFLGRPFMATTNTLIDVKNGNIRMSILGETVSFSVHNSKAMPSVNSIENCSFIDAIDALAEMSFVQDHSVEEAFKGSTDLEERLRLEAEFAKPAKMDDGS